LGYIDRIVLLVRLDGGMLAAPKQQLVAELTEGVQKLKRQSTPANQLRATISWLEERQREALFYRSVSTVSIIIIVSSEEVWSWHVGPHGTFSGTIDKLSFRSTDTRMPVLYECGIPIPPLRFTESELQDNASSIFYIGYPLGYECTRHKVEANSVIVEADRGTFPFGPLADDGSWSLRELWEKNAAWRHGVPGRALVVSQMQEIEVPSGWEVQTTVID